MRIKLIFVTVLVVSIGTFGLARLNNFISVDKCLDQGGTWNYRTNQCEYAKFSYQVTDSLIGSLWVSEGINGLGGDSLLFESETDVLYYMGELRQTFNSRYKLHLDTLTVETAAAGFEMEDTKGMEPNLIQKYIVRKGSLKLSYLANYRNGQWIEASRKRYQLINNFARVKR